jgi:hypothetical protein
MKGSKMKNYIIFFIQRHFYLQSFTLKKFIIKTCIEKQKSKTKNSTEGEKKLHVLLLRINDC